MSKSYKKKKETKDLIEEKEELSKKEIYDLNKKRKEEEKEKLKKKQKKTKIKKEKTNIGAKIFAIIMLLLMIGSVIASFASYMR